MRIVGCEEIKSYSQVSLRKSHNGREYEVCWNRPRSLSCPHGHDVLPRAFTTCNTYTPINSKCLDKL